MDFELSDDQQDLGDAARALLDGRADRDRVRAVVEAGGGLDRDLWAAMAEQGWCALVVPESLGGLGLGWVEAAVLLEQVGAHVAPAPFLGQLVALDALVGAEAAGAEGVVDWIERLAAGEAVAAVTRRAVDASAAGDGWQLSGRTEPAVYAPSADAVVVVADEGGGERGLHLVDLGAVGRPAVEPAMDRTRELGWVELDGAPSLRLGGPEAVTAYEDRGAVATSCELLGVAGRALDLAVEYAKEREQFGRPIGSFQAVKHRCADMLVDVEGMRSVAYWAAWCQAADDAEAPVAASTAKTWCADAATRVCASSLQVHGGIGFTWESDVHLLLKRAQLDALCFGDATHHRARLAGLLRERVATGGSVI